MDGDISLVYKNPSNVLNFLTVGDDFGDICLLDRLSHFTYVCETDVFCMFIPKEKFLEKIKNYPREQLFLERRATLRINQVMSLRGKVTQARAALLQKIKTQLSDPKAFLEQLQMQTPDSKAVEKNMQKTGYSAIQHHSVASKKSPFLLEERKSELTVLEAKKFQTKGLDSRTLSDQLPATAHIPDKSSPTILLGAHRSGVGVSFDKDRFVSENADEVRQRPSDFLTSPLEVRKKASETTTPMRSFVESEDKPSSKREQLDLEENMADLKALLQDPAFDPLNLQRILQSQEVEKLRVAGEAIKELEMTFTALGTGFQSKLIRSTSLDEEAQEFKYTKKQILRNAIRQTRLLKLDRLDMPSFVLNAPFLEDLEADSNQGKTPSKDKVRDFVFSEHNATRNEGMSAANKQKIKKGASALFKHKAIDRQKLLFVARLNKDHLDGSLMEDSEDNTYMNVG